MKRLTKEPEIIIIDLKDLDQSNFFSKIGISTIQSNSITAHAYSDFHFDGDCSGCNDPGRGNGANGPGD